MSIYNYSDFIDLNKDELLGVKDNLYFIAMNIKNKEDGDNTNFFVIEFDGKNYPRTLFSHEDKERSENYFNLMKHNHKDFSLRLVYREDPVGYPNNQSIVAFSLDEKPSKLGNIVYYEYNQSKDLLERHEALVDFAKSTNKQIENTTKLNLLKNKIKEIYPHSWESSNLRFDNSTFFVKTPEQNDKELINKVIEQIKKEKSEIDDYLDNFEIKKELTND